MTKTQLVETISQNLGHTKAEVSKFIDCYAATVAEALKKDGRSWSPAS